ncbi:MAG: 30S ribosomal protein S6 [Fibrobacterota bacterium]
MNYPYETVLIVDALLTDAAIEAELNKATELIKKNGELQNISRIGKRRLAYPIKKKTHGDYSLITFTGNGKLVDEMEQVFRFSDGVLRYLTVRQ